MGVLRLVLKSLKKNQHHTKKYVAILSILWSFSFLLLFDTINSWVSIIPFIIMVIKGVRLSIIPGVFLSFLWMIYILIIVSPLYFIIGKFLLLSVYIPIIMVYYKSPHEEANIIFLAIQDIFWDKPLLYWIRLISYIPNQRALEPFYSSITDDIAIGSIPLHHNDCDYLKNTKNIGLVINMCREYIGPILQYDQLAIKQLYLPTPDFCEPSYQHILLGVYTAKHFLNQMIVDKISILNNQQISNKIFIHCKAGRGRSVAMALCILIAIKFPNNPNEAMKFIINKRNVVEQHILHFHVVQKFIHRFNECQQNIDQLYKEDYLIS